MRVAFVSRWNATCGISLHAELVGRELLKMGHEVRVAAPKLDSANRDWHHKKLDVEDEEFVFRCFDETDDGLASFDESVLEEFEPDVIIVEAYPRLPWKVLPRVLERLRRDARILAVIHFATADEARVLKSVADLIDAFVVFDYRWISEVLDEFFDHMLDRIHIIPYPCYTPTRIRSRSRRSGSHVVFFSFGRQPCEEYEDFIRVLRKLRRSGLSLTYRVMRSDGLLPYREEWLVQWCERPPIERIYEYLSECDVHLLPKGRTSKVVVSSTVCQCLAAERPIVTPATRYVELMPEDEDGAGPVVKYRNIRDLEYKLIRLVRDEDFRERVIEWARHFVRTHSADRIARRFVELANSL